MNTRHYRIVNSSMIQCKVCKKSLDCISEDLADFIRTANRHDLREHSAHSAPVIGKPTPHVDPSLT